MIASTNPTPTDANLTEASVQTSVETPAEIQPETQPVDRQAWNPKFPVITWEKLPDDYVLDDEPVDNASQPPLAAALTESLELAGKLSETTLTTTNYGICATLDRQLVIKAPDWSYIACLRVPYEQVIRSYTPGLEGDPPVLVMEFLSDEEGKEYSNKPTYPPGKWFYYEQVLKVPNYVIFEPNGGAIEFYHLDDTGRYQLQQPNAENRYWVAEMDLFLGVWQGTREGRTGYWLRWWDAANRLLLWGKEQVEQERQRTEEERQRAEQERQRAEQESQRAEQERQRAEEERQRAEQERQRAETLAARLRAAGIDPDAL